MKYLFTLVFILASSFVLTAQNNFWQGGNGNWTNPNRWSLGVVPTATHNVVIQGGGVRIPTGYHAQANSMQVQANAKVNMMHGSLLEISGSNEGGALTVHGILNVRGFISMQNIPGAIGIHVLGKLNIAPTGAISLQQVTNTAIFLQGDLFSMGTILIDGTNGAGIDNEGIFTNTVDAVVNIDNANWAIINHEGATLTNWGTLSLGAEMNSGNILNAGEVINEECAELYLEHKLQTAGEGTTTNYGWTYENGWPNIITGPFRNGGMLEIEGNPIYRDSLFWFNASVIIGHIIGEVLEGQPVEDPILRTPYDPEEDSWIRDTLFVKFFTNEEATISAGVYDYGDNTWTPNLAAVGLEGVYVELTNSGTGCSTVVYAEIPAGVQSSSGPLPFGVQDEGNQPVVSQEPIVYPNPSTDRFNLNLPEEYTGMYTLKIYNTTGQVVLQQQINSDEEKNLSPAQYQNLSSGAYWLTLTNAGQISWQQKLIKL